MKFARAALMPAVIVISMFFLSGVSLGQELAGLPAMPLTKEAAVDYALSHNRLYKAAFEDVGAADQKVKEALADFFPKVDGAYAYRHFSEQPFVSIKEFGPAGSAIPFNLRTSNHWEINLVQPLFTGFGLEAQYKINKAGRQLSKFQREEVRLNLVRDVQATYLQTLLAEKLLEVARDNAASIEVQRSNAEAAFKQGVAAENDVLKAEVSLSEAVQRVRNAEKQLIILRSTLNQLLDIDLTSQVELAGIEEKTYQVPDLGELFMAAERNRPEYLAMATSIKQSEFGKTAARSRYYPKFSAFAQYYREGEDFTADRNPFTNNENTAVGVRMDWNLFEGGKTRATELEWDYRRRALEQRRDDLRQKIRLQVQNAFEQLKVAKANIATTRVALKQAEENERITTLQYKEQVVIFLEVLNAQVFIAQTRADFYQAIYGYEIAKAELERAIGIQIGS